MSHIFVVGTADTKRRGAGLSGVLRALRRRHMPSPPIPGHAPPPFPVDTAASEVARGPSTWRGRRARRQ